MDTEPLQHLTEQSAGAGSCSNAPLPAAIQEKRRDRDGVFYTQQEFVEYYGDNADEYWNLAAALSR